MKTVILSLSFVVAALSVPVTSFAQSNYPITRADVRADLVQVERAGYYPSRGGDINYPDDIQAAEAKIASNNNVQNANAYGGVAQNGTSSSGGLTKMAAHPTCVGPVSFCNLYFGS